MDEDTVKLMLALQIEDLESLAARWEGKGKAIEGSSLADDQIALELQKAELQTQQKILADRRMARSISHAVQDDGVTLATLMSEELRADQDRKTALRMSGKPYHQTSNLPDCHVDEDILSKFSFLNFRQVEDEDEDDWWSCCSGSISQQETGESSSWAAGRNKSNWTGDVKNECIACSEIEDTIQVPCQHHYCKLCVTRLVDDSTVDESLFPPRCCGRQMPMTLLRPQITDELAAKFELKAIELGTSHRTYCNYCRLFIRPDAIQGRRAHCMDCDGDTCVLCHGKFHDEDCPKDPALQALLELAQKTGWQRCMSCQNMIERRDGCNHMTCRCGYGFCYECGKKWKSCTCIVYDENMLLQRARDIAHRDAEPGAAPPGLIRLRQIANNLRERHDCYHDGWWRRIEGSHRCEECGDQLGKYILQCRECMLQTCAKCKRNRL